MRQSFFDNIQEKDITVACSTKEEVFYPHYISPLGIKHFSGCSRIGPCSGINGILFCHTGSVRTESGTELAAPFIVPVDRMVRVGEGSEGWLAVYRPEVINQSFVSWPDIPPEAENDPFAIRDRELLESVLPGSGSECGKRLALTPEEDLFMLRLFACLTDLLENKRDIYWPCRSRSFFLEILFFFWQRPAFAGTDSEYSKAQRVHEWLRVHYSEHISLAGLSKQFCSNRTTLQEEFRKEYSDSIMNVLNKIRVDAATTLMRNTELSLSEIGTRTGFCDYSNFYREFLRRKNAAPEEYRQRIKTVQIY